MAASRTILASLTFVSLIAAGCVQNVHNHGQPLEETALSDLRVGMSQADVMTRLGTPHTRGPFDANTWMFISTKQTSRAFLKPQLSELWVVSVTFDPVTQKLVSVQKHDTFPDEPLVMSKNISPDLIDKRPFFRRFFGTFGRWAKKYDAKNKTTQ